MSRGRVSPPEARAEISPRSQIGLPKGMSRMADQLDQLYRKLAAHIDDTFEEHRLAYVFIDGDNDDEEVFVCKCQEGFNRRHFNEHLKEKLRGPFTEILK